MNTIVIQIGNSDDKLSQKEWADFVSRVSELLHRAWVNDKLHIHFQGFSSADSPYQNACFVVEEERENDVRDFLLPGLRDIRKAFRQDSVAVTCGETSFW